MGPAGVEAWQRCLDEVVANRAAWPGNLWFAAVEDGLVAGLGRDASLVAAFRRDGAEFVELERTRRPGSWQDEQRIAQLEAQIQATLRQADESIRGPALPRLRVAVRDHEPAAGHRDRARAEPLWGRALRAGCFGLFLVGSGLLGGIYLYDARLVRQVDLEVGQHVAELRDSLAQAETNLAAAMASFDQESERVGRMQVELAADADQLGAKMAEALRVMMTLSETAIAEVEERLAQETNAVTVVVERLQQRGGDLDRGLDQVSIDLAALEQRLPELDRSFAAIDASLEEGRSKLAETVDQVVELQSTVPELLKWVDTERAGFERAFEAKRELMAAVDERITGLESTLEASDERLRAFDATVEQQLRQVEDERGRLEQAVGDLNASSELIATLVEGAEAELELARAKTQNQIEGMLTEVADEADLAVMRGADVLDPANAQAVRRIESAGDQATQTLKGLRAEEIAQLTHQIAATRAEVEQTSTELVASRQRMDEFVAERHNQLLADLERYARSMEARVQELLEALNVSVAQSDQKKS